MILRLINKFINGIPNIIPTHYISNIILQIGLITNKIMLLLTIVSHHPYASTIGGFCRTIIAQIAIPQV